MILTCPDCATRYFVEERRLGPMGRTVRCARCGSTWRAQFDDVPLELSASDDDAVALPDDEPLSFKAVDPQDLQDLPAPELPRAFRAKAEQRRKVRRAAVTGAIWTGLGCGFVALLLAAWMFRVDVVRVFPRAAAAYALVRVNATGLVFEAVEAQPSPDDPSKVTVQGRLRNVVAEAAPVPMLRVTLVDKKGFKVKSAVLKPQHAWIAAGGTQTFTATLNDPNARAADVDVAFALDVVPPPRLMRRPEPLPTTSLSRPAPVLRRALDPAPPSPAAAGAATANQALGLRGLDTDAALGVSPAPHG